STVTGQEGTYVLTLNATGSGISDPAGNLLSASAQDSWLTDTTVPTADIVDITPDPRNSAVGNVSIVFSESVSGVDLADCTLTRNGNLVLIPAGSLSGSASSYSLNLSTVTGQEGTYVLTLNATGSGISDPAGNLLSASAQDSWLTDTTVPTADIVDITPDPRNSAVGSVSIVFSESVSGVDLADFTLTRNGNLVLIPAGSLSGSGGNYTLNLTSVTGQEGTYVLTLNATGSGISDPAGNLLSASAQDSWTTDTTVPTADIVDITPDPRNSAVGSVSIVFSEPVSGVDLADFTLTRNGNLVLIPAGSLSGSGANYTLNLSTVTGLEGTYVLTLNATGSGIRDPAGNLLSASAQDSWTTDTTVPTADIVDITPDPRNSAVG